MAATLRCPICKKEVASDDPNIPFCSDRCRLIDLGNWATEKYSISAPLQPDDLLDVEDSDLPRPRESHSQ
jgi:uncharacterized protein